MEGYHAWEVLLKLPEPDLSVAFNIAAALGFDISIMAELLPAGVQGIKDGLAEEREKQSVIYDNFATALQNYHK